MLGLKLLLVLQAAITYKLELNVLVVLLATITYKLGAECTVVLQATITYKLGLEKDPGNAELKDGLQRCMEAQYKVDLPTSK